jgi:hypothetical protein
MKYFGKGKKEPEKSTAPPVIEEPRMKLPFTPSKTIKDEEATQAKEELKVSSLLKEITSYALTRLYEAEAEGKISEGERDQLTKRYKEELSQIEEKLSYSQSIIDLYKLEETQSELIGMFYEKIDELNRKIDDVRGHLGQRLGEVTEAKPKDEAARIQSERIRPKEIKPKPPTPKSPTEQKIESIREEVLKLIEKLDKTEAGI